MRLIDADELKKTLCEEYEAREHYIGEKMIEAIDNAPTVEPEILIKPIAEIKCEITEEEKQRLIELLRKEKPKIVKLEPERPQGEWIKKVDNVGFISHICSKCGAEIEVENPCDNKFCFNCGAEMRGKEE